MRWLKRMLGADPPAAPPREPFDPQAVLRAGFDCESRGDDEGAERQYRQIVEREPAHAEAHYFLARIAARHKRFEEASALLQQAVELRPGDAAYLLELGHVLFACKRVAEAVEVYRAGVALQPECTETLSNYAAALIELGRREEARIELERMRKLLPDMPQLHFNLAGIYSVYGRIDDAIAAYRRALALTPDHATTHSNLLLTLNYSEQLDAAAVFEEHRRFGARFARAYAVPRADPAWPRRLRIGYVSPDFRVHVVARFIEPVLSGHDRSRFETFCYYSHRQKDSTTEKLRALADHWLDCEDLSHAELAERIRADRIDILVDLAGHTGWNRLPAFALKPAPVQATYLGYPNTTGLDAIDYHITDAQADPPGESDRFYTERAMRLPVSYFCYRPEDDAPEVSPPPALAAGLVTFGCFNNFLKISDAFMRAAARILAAAPGSRLLLKSRPLAVADVAESVRKRLAAAGLDLQRVELRGWEAEVRNHLSVYGEVDIALDSFPYNGATTTCEALWMGVPVVTLAGDRHAGRMGASLLNAVGLGEFVARDVDALVALCTRLAGDLPRLAQLRRRLRERMRGSPLMDEARFTRALEQCYLEMWENRLQREDAAPGAAPVSAADRYAQALRARELGRLAEAQAACREILQAQPDHAQALALLWDLAFDAGTPGAAIDWLVKAIAVDDGVAAFHHMLGCSLQAEMKIGDAIAAFSRALALDPKVAKTHNNLGCLLERVGALDAALECYRNAVELDPGLAQARYNLGNAHSQAGDTGQAIACIEQAIALEPGHADWLSNLGSLRLADRRPDEAIACLQDALAIDPAYARAHASLGEALLCAGRLDEGLAAFEKALALKPEDARVESALLLALHCRDEGDARDLHQRHVAWTRRHAYGLPRATPLADPRAGDGRRLNVGYVCPDLESPLLARFIQPVLGAHDRDGFAVFCYSGRLPARAGTPSLGPACEHWRDISTLSEEAAADRIRADGIDILVDLAGHRPGGRLLLFARKPAPLQLSWLGSPGTTGLAEIDYRLTDAIADPQGAAGHLHTETLLRLAHGFCCYAPPESSPPVAQAPLCRNGYVTFGSFNDLARLTPQTIALWARLLLRLPNARLRLAADGLAADSAQRSLRNRFLSHGIGAERLELCASAHLPASRLEWHADIDIALDVHPCNGAAELCEALWMGVPVVALEGSAHASRLGASLLARAGFPELVARDPEEYLHVASRLAGDAEALCVLRAGMRERLRAAPLLGVQAFTRALEATYRDLWKTTLAKGRPAPAPAQPRSADPPGEHEPLRLHIGGWERRAGWKTLDVQPGPAVDYVGDCADLGRFADASVDEIYASHVIEHLDYREKLPQALREFHRVLKPGAVARISVPDFQVLCRLFLDARLSGTERFQVMRMAFGGQMDASDYHRVGLTYEFLCEYLSAAGFASVERVPEFGLFDDSSALRFAGEPISLNVVARK